MELLSILGISFTATVLAVVLSQYKKEYAVGVAAFAGIAIFIRLIFIVIEPIFEFRDAVLDSGVKGSYFNVALKTLGICLISGFISDICKDFGQTALGNFETAAAKCTVFVMSLPILIELLGAALKFIG